MARAADYSIQGFIYQFNKTLLEIVTSDDEAVVMVEGVVEDIDILVNGELTAIQCKYHETKTTFSLSLIYKPLLLMMLHFRDNPGAQVKYRLFAHFPKGAAAVTIGKTELQLALDTTNKELTSLTAGLKGTVDIDGFLPHFVFEPGESLAALTTKACLALEPHGFSAGDVQDLAYPNAIQLIANLSIQHDPEKRRTTRRQLLAHLRSVRSTAVTRWTLALSTRTKLLQLRRKQLQQNLKVNARRRSFILADPSNDSLRTSAVLFITEYVKKYHHKSAHIETPIFCFDCDGGTFDDLRTRLHAKGVVAWDGFVGSTFYPERFMKKPLVVTVGGDSVQREFTVRIVRVENAPGALNSHKCEDLFIFGAKAYPELDLLDINVEHCDVETFKQAQYLLGVTDGLE